MKLEVYEDAERFFLYCETSRRLSNDSIRAYGFDIQMFTRFLKKQEPTILDYAETTKEILDLYVSDLQSYAAKTIRRKIAGLRSFFSFLEYSGKITKNPFEKFKLRLREAHKLRISMTEIEILTLLNAVYDAKPYEKLYKGENIKPYSKDFIWIRNVAIMELLFAGGMRVSELCSIQFTDLDLINRTVLIHGKGNKERYVYLENTEVVNAVIEYLKVRHFMDVDNSYLFLTKNLDPLTTNSVRVVVSKYAKESGLEKNITPHVFRHTFATLLLEEGVDIKYIQDFLGHSSISTTQLYLHTSDKQKRRIIAQKHPRGNINMGKETF